MGTSVFPSGGSGGDVVAAGALTAGQIVVGDGGTDINVGNLSGDVTTSGGTVTTLKTAAKTRSIGFVFSGATLEPAQFIDAYIPYACAITVSTVTGDTTGDVVFDVLTSNSFTTAPVTSIVASAPPTMTGNDGAQDTTLTGWTTAVAAGTRMRCSVTSTSGLGWASLTLTVTV